MNQMMLWPKYIQLGLSETMGMDIEMRMANYIGCIIKRGQIYKSTECVVLQFWLLGMLTRGFESNMYITCLVNQNYPSPIVRSMQIVNKYPNCVSCSSNNNVKGCVKTWNKKLVHEISSERTKRVLCLKWNFFPLYSWWLFTGFIIHTNCITCNFH